MEAVRIIAMSMILILHYFSHVVGLGACGYYRTLVPFVISGVDLFVLISGYFLINVRWQSILRLGFIIWGFILVNIVATSTFAGGLSIDTVTLVRALFMPFSAKYYWFVNVYFGLMMFSPLLNKGLKVFSSRDLRLLLGMLLFVECIVCFVFRSSLDFMGYGILNFITLYILGYYLRRDALWIKRFSTSQVIIVLICALLVYVGLILLSLRRVQLRVDLWAYNNPLIIITAVCITVVFARLQFRSRFVNSLAGAAFGAYLLQDGLFGQEFLYNYLKEILRNSGYPSFIMLATALFFAFWAASWLFTNLFTAISKPLINWAVGSMPRWMIIDFK